MTTRTMYNTSLHIKSKFSAADKVLFDKMYRNYIKELGAFSERIANNPVTDEEIEEIYSNEFLLKIFISNPSGTVVGFCLVGFGPNTHPDTNYYIAELYILPEFRRLSFGRNAIKELLALFPGRYCYHVLNKNSLALEFWKRITSECDCKKLELQDTLNIPNCRFFAFTKQL